MRQVEEKEQGVIQIDSARQGKNRTPSPSGGGVHRLYTFPGGRNRGFEGDFRLLHRVDEPDGAGVERDASVGVGAGSAVLEVALDGAADVGELAADLVMTAGEEFHLDQMIAFGAFQVVVPELRLLGFAARSLGDEGLVQLFIPGHPVGQERLGRFGPGAAQCPIGFVDFSLPEHRIQAFQGLGGLGQDHDAAHRAVQAVGNPHEHLAGFFVPLCDEGLQRLTDRLVARLVALDDFARALVENEQMVVLVEDASFDGLEFLVVELPVDHRCHSFPQR